MSEIEEGLVVRPGDTLIVRIDPTARRQLVDAVKDRLARSLPDVHIIVIGCEQLCVVRPDQKPGVRPEQYGGPLTEGAGSDGGTPLP